MEAYSCACPYLSVKLRTRSKLYNIVRKRGFLGVMGPLSIAVGVLASYICGALVEYSSIPYCIIGFPILFLIVMLLIPETPHTLIRQKKMQES